MKITVSQHGKKLIIEFQAGRLTDKYYIDKAEDFLICIDKFVRKRKISIISPIGHIEFENTGILTERVTRAIIGGLGF